MNEFDALSYGSFAFLFFGIIYFIVNNDFLMLGLGIVGVNLAFLLEKFCWDFDYEDSESHFISKGIKK